MKKIILSLLTAVACWGLSSCDGSEETAPAPAAQPLTTPAPVASQITDHGFAVAWPAVENAASYSYTLLSRNANGSIAVVVPQTGTAGTEVACDELKPATEYLFRVMAAGDGETWLDSEWSECVVTTEAAPTPPGAWVTFEVEYETGSYQCKIKATFTPNDRTAACYADCIYASYFDDDPDDPDFEPNTEEDLIAYLCSQKPVAGNVKTFSWSYDYPFILGVVGVDADGNRGQLNWVTLKTPPRTSSGDDRTSDAALRIQHVVANSADIDGAPANCFATVYRFERTDGARFFRYEDGFYEGDFAKRTADYWRKYFGSAANASGEDYEGYYSGWISSNDLELSADGFYHYGVTFWDPAMAGETYELICTAYDADGIPGAPACYTVALPDELPAVTPASAPALRAGLPALFRSDR